MRVLVTGGAGFIGTNLVHRLLHLGHEPAVFDDFSTGLESNLAGMDIQVSHGSLDDAEAVAASVRGVDAVVHLGARGSVPRSVAYPIATHEVNATGTLNVLEAARAEGAYVVMSSSSSVYGANPLLPKVERTWTQPLSPYAASKLAGEGYMLGYQASYGMSTLVLRFFNVFGPWQRPDHDYAAVVPKWLWKMMTGQPIEVHGDGTQTRDFTYVDSVVDVLVDALERRVSLDSPVNLAFGKRVSLLEVLARMEALLGVVPEVQFAAARVGDVRNSENDPTLLRSVFPTVTPMELDPALERTAEWLREYHHGIRSPLIE
jgi:UDP-glucose 4-epimerase